MPKTKISEFSATPANNTDIDSINIAEGCAPSGINDAIRELMAQLKDFQTGAVGDSFNGPIGTSTAAAGAFTTLSASSTTTLSGLTASTALALDASKNVVSVTNTGTGNNVLATSPTLVTPILGTPTSGTLTNATGLPISTGVSGLGSGVATFLATPSSANLAAALTDETGSGSAVFATSPTLVTPLLGTPTSGVATNLTGLPLTTGVTGTLPTANGGTNLTSFTSGGVVYASSTSALATGSGLVFDASGNLGIGTTSPTGKLDLLSTYASDTTVQARIRDNTGWSLNFTGTASGFKALQVQDSAGAATYTSLLLNPLGGNVGIGTSSPTDTFSFTKALDVNGSSGAFVYVRNNGSATNVGGIGYSGTDLYITNKAAGNIRFFCNTDATERARINSAGELLVGTTTNAGTSVGSRMFPTGLIQGTRAESTDATTQFDLYSTGASAYRFYVGMGGTIFATSIVISAISDQRLKENVRDIDTGLDAIMALKPRRFDWKEGKGQDKKDVAGFIAQEFEDVFPECVSTSKAGADGIEYKNINHETLIPTLVKAMQEQQAIIESLKARLDAANL